MNYEHLIKTVMNSDFFRDRYPAPHQNCKHTMLLNEIKTKSICLPLRMRHYVNLWSLTTLNELLDIEPGKLLRCRNYGLGSIEKSRRAILNYLSGIRDIIESYEISLDAEADPANESILNYKNTVIKYFPLLKNTYKTSVFYYCFIDRDLSVVNVPKAIDMHFCRKKDIKNIIEILNVDFDALIRERMIGFKSISSLQNELINLLQLEKIGLNQDCRYYIH